ncbi:MAG: hypothetical protein ACFFCV_08265 [Promethearchaeota archaeon]
MGWTPPSKLIVIITFLLMAFGIFIFMDLLLGLWPSILAGISIPIGTYDGWIIIALILFFLTWFLFFLGVKLKGI